MMTIRARRRVHRRLDFEFFHINRQMRYELVDYMFTTSCELIDRDFAYYLGLLH